MSDDRQRTVVDLLPSAHWVNATVIVLDCGHRFVLPNNYTKIGAPYDCTFCEDAITRNADQSRRTGLEG